MQKRIAFMFMCPILYTPQRCHFSHLFERSLNFMIIYKTFILVDQLPRFENTVIQIGEKPICMSPLRCID